MERGAFRKEEELLQISKISLILNTYNDLFSSFDPRHFSEKALSDDFLAEVKRASADKPSGVIELRFLIPHKQRKPNQEKVIKQRMKEHFRKHHNLLRKERISVIKQGMIFCCFGIALMFVATFILFSSMKTLLTTFLVTLFEPASWFLFWEGLNLAVFESKKKKPDLDFYSKMAKSKIRFLSL